jgi:DNA-binding MurR/RpiR family transcriptional regulator
MSIYDEIFARIGELYPAEKKVARALLSGYPAVALGSAASLADAAGTSIPTVLRLLSRLGFGSYRDLQHRLREEISNQAKSPASRTELGRFDPNDSDVLRGALAEKAELVERLTSSVPPSEFDRAVQALAAKPRHVTISGGYFTRYLAMLLATQLDQAIENVDYVDEPLGRDIGRFLRLAPGSIAVILDFRRYELASQQAAELAKRQGATVIVITDQELSPAVESADIVLPVAVNGIPFDSLVGLISILEALVEAVLLAMGDRGIERMKQWETSVHVARSYRTGTMIKSSEMTTRD